MRNQHSEENNYRDDHRTRAGEEREEKLAGFDETRMVFRVEMPECEKPCCTPPYSYIEHRSEWDYSKSPGRMTGICGFEFVRGTGPNYQQGRVEEQSYCLTYSDGETNQGLGPLGFGTHQAVYNLIDELNADWKPAEHIRYVDLPAKFEVCDTCQGKGSHVNPSIDSGGLSREDFDEDPGFREEYFSGAYDVPCYGCAGRRVVPVIDTSDSFSWSEDQKTAFAHHNEVLDDRAEMAAVYAAERRMGA